MANKKRKPRPQPARPPAKSARRLEERRLRTEAERKEATARRTRSLLIRLVAGAMLAVIVYFGLQLTRHTSPTTPASLAPTTSPTIAPSTLPGIQDANAPWSAGNDPANLKARLSAIGLSALGAEGQVLHIHQHLEIFVNGRSEKVPTDIGIPLDGSFISPIHTHTPDGIIHVESPVRRDFTLGEFFDVWGVTLTPTCIGGYCNSGEATLVAYVNGHEVAGDPGLIVLGDRDEIVVTYGTPSQLPNPIPSSFKFPLGL
jgi:hypothetical protein